MIVIETKLDISDEGKMSFSANVLAVSKDLNVGEEKKAFENVIIPNSLDEIDGIIKHTKSFSPSKHNEFIAQILNVIVRKAKEKNFNLTRIGQNEKYPLENQLEFKRG